MRRLIRRDLLLDKLQFVACKLGDKLKLIAQKKRRQSLAVKLSPPS